MAITAILATQNSKHISLSAALTKDNQAKKEAFGSFSSLIFYGICNDFSKIFSSTLPKILKVLKKTTCKLPKTGPKILHLEIFLHL